VFDATDVALSDEVETETVSVLLVEDGLITPLITTATESLLWITALVKKTEQVTVVVAVLLQFPTWVFVVVSVIELLVWLFSPVPAGKESVTVSAWPAAIPPVFDVLKLTV
jgi:hypothetical protein